MARMIDISDKLESDENPRLVVRDKELEVKADAETVLKVMGLVDDGITPSEIMDVVDLIFDEKAKEDLKELKLSFKNYQAVISSAFDLIMGSDGDAEGE